jgi:2-haloacid dehalogenase
MTSPAKAACVFDAYGTLFNVHSAVGRHANSLGKAAAEISNLWRTKQLEYSWVHSLMRRHVDFWELTQRALDYALTFHRVSDDQLKRALMESYLALDAYDEIRACYADFARAVSRPLSYRTVLRTCCSTQWNLRVSAT